MARTYRAIVLTETKGKADEYATYECTAKSEAKAKRIVLDGAYDMTPTGSRVGICGLSRLKGDKPVNTTLDQYSARSTMLVSLGNGVKWDIDKKVPKKVAQALAVVPALELTPPEGVMQAPPGKPYLSAMLTDKVMYDMAEDGYVVGYDTLNQREEIVSS